MQKDASPPYPVLHAMALALAGFALWTVGDAAVRYLKIYPLPTVIFLSEAFGLIFLALFARRLGGWRSVWRGPKLRLRLLRGAVLALSGVLSFFTFTHLDLASAYAVIFAAPMMAKILSILLNGERIPLKFWGVTLLGFCGVLIVVRPGFAPVSAGMIAALACVFLFSLGYVLSRTIGEEGQTHLGLIVFIPLIQALVYVPLALPRLGAVGLPPDLLALSALIGASGILGCLMVTRAFARAPAAAVAPLHYTQMLWGLALGAALFREYPDFWTLAGAGVIVFSGLLLLRVHRTKK